MCQLNVNRLEVTLTNKTTLGIQILVELLTV